MNWGFTLKVLVAAAFSVLSLGCACTSTTAMDHIHHQCSICFQQQAAVQPESAQVEEPEPTIRQITYPAMIGREPLLEDSRALDPSEQTTVQRFSITATVPDFWLMPGDSFVCKYRDFHGPRPVSSDVSVLLDGVNEICVNQIKTMSGGLLLLRVHSPVSFKRGETKYFSVVMDASIFRTGERLFFELQEFFRPDNGIGVEFALQANLKMTHRFR